LKKTYFIFLSSLFFMCCFSVQSYAYTNTGAWIEKYSGNDNYIASLGQEIRSFPGYPIDLEYYARIDAPSYATTDADDRKSGKWSAGPFGNLLHAYTMKRDTKYSRYWQRSSDLTKGGGNVLEISYFRGLITDSATPVPEPATIFLFGAGLIGLGGLRRKGQR
jgi:PEP-CTERM motif